MSKKILLIDDDIDLVEMNKSFLESHGYEVVFAYNGADGLKVLEAEHPDLLVLDVMMTEVGEGFEVAREVRKKQEFKGLPIIMLSAVNELHGFNLTIGPDESWNPVTEFVDKPIERNKLLDKIKYLLEK